MKGWGRGVRKYRPSEKEAGVGNAFNERRREWQRLTSLARHAVLDEMQVLGTVNSFVKRGWVSERRRWGRREWRPTPLGVRVFDSWHNSTGSGSIETETSWQEYAGNNDEDYWHFTGS